MLPALFSPFTGIPQEILLTTTGICLYYPNPLKNWDCTTVYLSPTGIIISNGTSSGVLPLTHIKDINYSPAFLRSSAKLSLEIEEKSFNTVATQWLCSICSFPNEMGKVCLICGVPKPQVSNESNSQLRDTDLVNSNDFLSDVKKCPICTFENHPDLTKCEICGAKLRNSCNSDIAESFRGSIKFSFRYGGSHDFYYLIQRLLPIAQLSHAEITGGMNNGAIMLSEKNRDAGIHALTSKAELEIQNAAFLMNVALENLESLLNKTDELIELGSKLTHNAKIHLPITALPLPNHAINEELKRQLKLILPSKFLTFYELYNLYNSQRPLFGLNTISPQTLRQILDELAKSGTLNVVDVNGMYLISKPNVKPPFDLVISFVNGNTREEISKEFGLSGSIVDWMLEVLIKNGEIVIDECEYGVTYWPNQILRTPYQNNYHCDSHGNEYYNGIKNKIESGSEGADDGVFNDPLNRLKKEQVKKVNINTTKSKQPYEWETMKSISINETFVEMPSNRNSKNELQSSSYLNINFALDNDDKSAMQDLQDLF